MYKTLQAASKAAYITSHWLLLEPYRSEFGGTLWASLSLEPSSQPTCTCRPSNTVDTDFREGFLLKSFANAIQDLNVFLHYHLQLVSDVA